MNTDQETHYMLLMRGNHDWYSNLSPEELQATMNRFQAWMNGISERGILRGASPLQPEGKIVSGKNGRVVADGPFAESKEAIGGYFLIAADSLEDAVAIAKASPALEYGGDIEVRVVAEECPMMTLARQYAEQHALATA